MKVRTLVKILQLYEKKIKLSNIGTFILKSILIYDNVLQSW